MISYVLQNSNNKRFFTNKGRYLLTADLQKASTFPNEDDAGGHMMKGCDIVRKVEDNNGILTLIDELPDETKKCWAIQDVKTGKYVSKSVRTEFATKVKNAVLFGSEEDAQKCCYKGEEIPVLVEI